jgi:hypothetical protein
MSARLAGGKILLHCHRGCSIEAIAQALKINVGDLSDKPVIVATYPYEGEWGVLLYEVVRYFPKDFKVRRPDGNGGWVWSLKGIPRVPFRLPELLPTPAGEIVVICEGEKDVLALVALGFTATTNLGGATIDKSNGTAGKGKWLSSYNDYFQGRRVIIIPDNDEAGRAHAVTIAHNLRPVAKSLKLIALPGLPEKGDVSDWLAAGGTKAELLKIVEAAPEWADPNPTASVPSVPTFAEPRWPDPPGKEAFHGLAGRIVHAIEPASEADPAAMLVQTLVAYGNVIGRAAHFVVEADLHHGNEYAVVVGRTSKARKGTSWGRIERLFKEAQERWVAERVQSGLSSGEGLIWSVRDPILKQERIKQRGEAARYEEVEADPGIADKRLLIYEPEFCNVLKQTERQGNTLSAILRNAWDGRDLRSMTKNSPAKATGAHVSLCGHITADELRRYLTATETANGFANRFMWFCADRSKHLPEGGTIDPAAWDGLRAELAEAIAFATSAGLVTRDEPARQVWREVYGDLSEGKPGLAGALLARAEAHVLRLALLYALLDRSQVIKAEHLLAALALWDYAERSVYFIFGDSMGDPVADDLLRMLRSDPAGLTRNQMMDLFGRHASSDRIGRALGMLLQHRLARMEKEATGGRSAERWFAVPGRRTFLA